MSFANSTALVPFQQQAAAGNAGASAGIEPFISTWYGPLAANASYTINASNRHAILSVADVSKPFKTSLSAFSLIYSQFLNPTPWVLSWSGLTAPTRAYNIRACTRWMRVNDDGSLSEILSNNSGVDVSFNTTSIVTSAASSGSVTPGSASSIGNNPPPVMVSSTPIKRLALVFSAFRSFPFGAYTGSGQAFTDDLWAAEPTASFTLTLNSQNMVLNSTAAPDTRTITKAQRDAGVAYPPANTYGVVIVALS